MELLHGVLCIPHSPPSPFSSLELSVNSKVQDEKFLEIVGLDLHQNSEMQEDLLQDDSRWIYQQGLSVIVKSFNKENKERMKENLGIFDWELSEEELQQISQIPQHRGFSGEILISPTGPYKTLQEFWDEDS